MKIGYFADGLWAHKAFEKLINDKELQIAFVCLRYGSEDKILRDFANSYSIDCFTHQNINSHEFINKVREYNCDIFVSMSFDQIFKEEIINLIPLRTINCHAGKLPFYRGRNVLNWVLINDEKEFGITVHYIDTGIDTGDIILQRTYPITDEDNYATLLEKAQDECSSILYDAVKMIQNKDVKIINQTEIHPVGMYCTQRKQGDEKLDWNQTSREVFNFVRAICKPGPGARSFVNEEEIIINEVNMVKDAPIYRGIPGAVMGIGNSGFLVKTSDTFVEVTDYSFKGKVRVGDRLK